jgi:hypothetical protein
MATVTVYIAPAGTPVLDDGTGKPGASALGHMWYQIDDGNGGAFSFGFAPQQHGSPYGIGAPVHNDTTNYQTDAAHPIYARTFAISTIDYGMLMDFGNNPDAYGFDLYYNGLLNSCIDYVWRGMAAIGLNPSYNQGDVLPANNIDELNSIGETTIMSTSWWDSATSTLHSIGEWVDIEFSGITNPQYPVTNNIYLANTTTLNTTNTHSISETPVSIDNSTLINTGATVVKGVGDVNTASGITAWFNNSITGDFRPGAVQLAPVKYWMMTHIRVDSFQRCFP